MAWDGVHVLVQQAKQGNREAVGALYTMAQPYLLGLAQKLLGPNWPHKSVSDLTQETWMRAWQGLPTFQGADDDADTGALFRAWLARTMKNVRLNDVRFDAAKCRQGPLGTVPHGMTDPEDSTGLGGDPPGHELTPSENVRRDEQRTLIQGALHKLSDPNDLEIVRLRFFEELSFTEIGQRLNRDESTVRYHLQRILEYLGQELKGLR